jgi:hypothetical protein
MHYPPGTVRRAKRRVLFNFLSTTFQRYFKEYVTC